MPTSLSLMKFINLNKLLSLVTAVSITSAQKLIRHLLLSNPKFSFNFQASIENQFKNKVRQATG